MDLVVQLCDYNFFKNPLNFVFQRDQFGASLWSNGYDSMLPKEGVQVQTLVRELDPICCN